MNTEDRELLEYAAKAANRDVLWKVGMWRGERYEGLHDRSTGIPTTWNPLTDDGDAFRLAVELGLVVNFSRPSAGEPFKRHEQWIANLHDKATHDRHAHVRRAITRAAAEIGRRMSD